ncbi:uncharacterized protein [Amphiura filiformis]|uniref:uncharacterized protein n=1 Tax=Amphiura filiformis TaxID=82378 RepID=UPI003B20C2C3
MSGADPPIHIQYPRLVQAINSRIQQHVYGSYDQGHSSSSSPTILNASQVNQETSSGVNTPNSVNPLVDFSVNSTHQINSVIGQMNPQINNAIQGFNPGINMISNMQSNSSLESARRFHNAQWVPNVNVMHQSPFARTLTHLSCINKEQAWNQGRAIQAQDLVRQAPAHQMTENPDVNPISSIEYARRFYDDQLDFNAVHQNWTRNESLSRINEEQARNQGRAFRTQPPVQQIQTQDPVRQVPTHQMTEHQGAHGTERNQSWNQVQEDQRGDQDQVQYHITRDLTTFESYMRGECSLSALSENVQVQRLDLMSGGSVNKQTVSTVGAPAHGELQTAGSDISLSSLQGKGNMVGKETTLQVGKGVMSTEAVGGCIPVIIRGPDAMHHIGSIGHRDQESDQRCLGGSNEEVTFGPDARHEEDANGYIPGARPRLQTMEPIRKDQSTELSQNSGGSRQRNQDNFERHLNTHNVQESFQCTTCGKAFSGAGVLEEHKEACNPVSSEGHVGVTNRMDTSAEGRSAEGTSDEGTNRTEGSFEVMNGNNNEPDNIMKCLKCGGLFSGTEALIKHVMLVHRKKRTEGHRGPIEREEPANAGIRATESHIQAMELLRQDQSTELGQKSNMSEEGRYTCGVCGKQFFRQGNLDKHVTTHRRQKSFSCPACMESFPRVAVLRIHQKFCKLASRKKLPSKSNEVGVSHINEGGRRNQKQVNKLKCPKCSKMFPGKEVLKKHIIKVHRKKHYLPQKVAKLKCSKCSKLFSGKDVLTKHMKVHHKKNLTQLARPLSGNNTLRKHALKILAKSKPKITEKKNACRTCGKQYRF